MKKEQIINLLNWVHLNYQPDVAENTWYDQHKLGDQGVLEKLSSEDVLDKYLKESKIKIKTAKPKTEIPEDKIEEFNQLWPEFKLPTGKYGRSSKPELKSAFQAFFKEFPDYNDWIIIMESARIYLMEREQDNWNFTRRSKYFIRRQNRDGSSEYELSDYYLRIRDGVQEVPRDEPSRWEPKVY